MSQNRKRSVGQPRKPTAAEAAAFNQQLAEAKQQAAEVMAAYRRLSPLAENELYNLLTADPATRVGELCQMIETHRNIVRHTRAKYRRGPEKQHARTANRDAVIVQLRDKEALTFGVIARRLLSINPAWSRPVGRPLSRDAVEKAYHRQKLRPESDNCTCPY